jgi:hypothetical protein
VFFEIVLALLVLAWPARRASAEPPLARPVALEVDAGLGVGGLVEGAQRHLPVYPIDDEHVAGGVGLGLRCFWHRVGGEAELELGGAQGFDAAVLRAGGVVQLVRDTEGRDAIRLDLGAGANRTWLRLSDGLGPTAVAAGRPVPGEIATGFGYYGHLDIRWESHMPELPHTTFITSMGLQYEYQGPRFSGAAHPFDGHTVELRLRAGLRF